MKRIRFFCHCLLLPLFLILNSCAFYDKQFVSRIKIEGRNYRGMEGDEGVFYIDNEPLIRLGLGCHKQSMLGQTVFPLVPLPILLEEEAHDSIAREKFSITLSHMQDVAADLANLNLSIQFDNNSFPLNYLGSEDIEYHTDYRYRSNIPCGQIRGVTLNIQLAEYKTRSYVLHFEEEVRRRVKYHAGFVT